MEDSRRWRNILRRPGDIVISTPPKCGTTWTQQIVASLLWPSGEMPASRGQMSPWVDSRMEPIDELAQRLEAQDHRRFLKSHSPGDCIPFDEQCRYIAIYRDPRDALVSWGNHRAKMRPEIVDAMNSLAGPAVTPMARSFDGDYNELFPEWSQYCSPVLHLASWWPRRHRPNVLLVHYTDLLAEPQGEMQRMADFLDLTIEAHEWAAIQDRCSLPAVGQDAAVQGGLERVFDGGAASFFNQGVNGRWATILDATQIELVLDHLVEHLYEDAAVWLTNGSVASGCRPEEGKPAPVADESARPHPIFGRIQRRSSRSIDAITDRRVEQAREEGLFDNLALTGKPIPDIDHQRQPGWWANQFVTKERNKVKAMQLEEQLRSAMPALWRLKTEAEVRTQVGELNEQIAAYNKVTTLQQRARLDVVETLATWRHLKDQNS